MESTHQTLQQQLASLSKRHENLGSRLVEAAQELQQTGIPVPETLLEDLVKYHRDFNHLHKEVMTEGESLSQAHISLLDLEKQLRDRMQPPNSKNQLQKALSLLERVLSLTHKDIAIFEPLDSLKQTATQLRSQLNNSTMELSTEAEALISGVHPLSAVMTLVETPEGLDDQQWVILEEKVSATFGKSLAVAISRGKIELSGVSTESSSTPTPATNPDIVILGTPTSTAPQDVIIVPSVEIPKTPPTIDGTNIIFGNAPLAGKSTPVSSDIGSIGLQVGVTIRRLGDREYGPKEYAGTRGQGLPLEAFQISLIPPVPGLSLRYQAHISEVGDTTTFSEGQQIGEPGKNRQIEGFAIELTGPQASNYDIFYTAHVQNVGDVPVCSNGEFCGTRARGLRVEGMQVWIEAKA